LATGLAGLAGTALYAGATAVGAAVSPGYSHLADPISELTSSHAPHRAALAAAYVGYNLAVAVLGYVLWRGTGRHRLTAVGGWLLAAGSLAGIAQVTAFPQDTGGGMTSTTGTVHVVLAGLSALLTVAATIVYGLALRGLGHPRAARFCCRCTGFIVLTGPIAAASADTQLMGAAERLPIGAFLVWLTGLAVWALRHRQPRRCPPTGLGQELLGS
jgi:hypothetical protein